MNTTTAFLKSKHFDVQQTKKTNLTIQYNSRIMLKQVYIIEDYFQSKYVGNKPQTHYKSTYVPMYPKYVNKTLVGVSLYSPYFINGASC